MDSDLGYSLGIRAGRRWGNLEGEIHLGYLYNSYQVTLWIAAIITQSLE